MIYEHSAVTEVLPGKTAIVETEQGEVRAQYVVLAGNAYLGGLVPELGAKSMPCGSQIIASEPLEEALAKSCCQRITASRTAITCWITSAFPATTG